MNEALGLGILNSVMILLFVIWNGLLFNGLKDDIDKLKEELNNTVEFDSIEHIACNKKLVFDDEHKCKDIDLVPFWYEQVKIVYVDDLGLKNFGKARIIPDTIGYSIVYRIITNDSHVTTISAKNVLFIALLDTKDNKNDTNV